MLWHWQSKLKTTEYKAEILVKRSLEIEQGKFNKLSINTICLETTRKHLITYLIRYDIQIKNIFSTMRF
jgi:hypothetical protein